MNARVYQQITERIIALLEQGTVPWHKPWKARTGLPRSFVTKRPYRGVNVFLLLAMNYEYPFWLTFRQALQLGGNVRKGEKSCPVVFWKKTTIEDEEAGQTKEIRVLRLYHVFNVAQCEGLKVETARAEPPVNGVVKPAEIVAQMPQPPVIKHGMTRAGYSLLEDCVEMPLRERFDREEHFFCTLYHELVHATGHQSRLNRSTLTESAGFGSDPYCKEELIAEMGAAFLCGHAEIVERTINNSAAYIHGWLERLRQDKTLLVQASAQAQRAADFILGHTGIEAKAAESGATEALQPLEAAA